jgi:hypothetical protein
VPVDRGLPHAPRRADFKSESGEAAEAIEQRALLIGGEQ